MAVWQRWQGQPQQRAVAALRTASDVRARQLPHPLGNTLDPAGGRIGWWAEQLPAATQGLRLTPIRQEADVPEAHATVWEDVEQDASEPCVRLERHGLHTIPLPPVPGGAADLSVLHIDEAVLGDRHAVRRAPDRVQDLFGASKRLLGRDHPVFVT